jgi:hypothetical protein
VASPNYTTITGTFEDGSGTALSGTAVFTPSATVYATGAPLVSADLAVGAKIVSGSLVSAASGPLTLLATDNTGVTVEGSIGFWYWNVTVTVGGVTLTPFSFLLPSSPSTVDLYALTGTGSSAGGFSNPMTTLGDIIYGAAAGVASPLAGNTSASPKVLLQTGSGSVSAAPAWTAFDATASDFQPAGVAAGGSAGKPADAGHVHPHQPWQFLPETYGAKGDAIVVSDGSMAASSATLTCSTSTPFTSTAVDGGKTVYVYGAGASGADLVTTISSVSSSSAATLATAASTTISGHGVAFGTSDTTAVNNAVSAAVTYAQNHAQYGEVLFRPCRYMIAGAPVTGSPAYGNAQIPLPLITQTGAAKITLALTGMAADAAAVLHWAQTAPVVTGPVLICPRLDGTNDATNGPAAVIGGPYDGYGAPSSGDTWSNLSVIVDSLQVAVPYNSTYCGFDFWGVACAAVRNSSCMAMGIVASGGAWPQLQDSGANITNTWTFGLRMPSSDNNDRCDVTEWTCEGLAHGIMPSEHTTIASCRSIQCVVGIGPYCGSNSLGNGMHVMDIHHASVEGCGYAIGRLTADNTPVWVTIDVIDIELGGSGIVYDSNNVTYGSVGFRVTGTNFFTNPGITPGYYTSAPVSGAANLRLVQLHMPAGPVSSPAAAPATTVAWFNGYYRDAWITVALSGGHTFTSLNIDAVAQPNAASAGTYQFLLPSGHSYTPTYSAGTLTHTVTLL